MLKKILLIVSILVVLLVLLSFAAIGSLVAGTDDICTGYRARAKARSGSTQSPVKPNGAVSPDRKPTVPDEQEKVKKRDRGYGLIKLDN